MADMKLDEFFDKHADFQHYVDLRQRPQEYWDWPDNRSHAVAYAKWVMEKSNIPSLRMEVDVPNAREMAQEAEEAIKHVVKHRGEIHPGWYSVTLHGSGKHITEDWNAPIYEGKWTERPEYDWTEIADDCPTIRHWLENNWKFKEYHRVRLMLLEPGGAILPHKDFDERRLAAYNFALTNPPGNEFCMEDAGLIPWRSGECRAIDIGRLHAVRNIGDHNRIHMIIHGIPDSAHAEIMCASYDTVLRENGML